MCGSDERYRSGLTSSVVDGGRELACRREISGARVVAKQS